MLMRFYKLQRIRLRFETLTLEKSDQCEYDYLAVYDGKNEV